MLTQTYDITPSAIGAEPSFSKNSAFNKNFGTTSGTVCQGNDSRLSDSRPASDVSAWAKASTKPSYTASEVGAVPVTGASNLSGDFYPASTGTVSLGKSDRPFKEVVAGSFDARSDIRLKSNIIPCQVKDISQIEVKEFDLDGVEGREIGVIAQELQKQFPELVKEGSDEMRTLTVRESKIVYYLLDEMKRLKKELKEKELIA